MAAVTYLRLLESDLNKGKFFVPDALLDLAKRRDVSCLSLLYKIFHNSKHLLHPCLYERFVPTRPTRNILRLKDLAFSISRYMI